ncbi:group 1 glycosyl transferase [Natrialba chahannaoensis JCM 10990]|uniref:Group 1 glycosyl transferase n=1 Tax=Natrialba chahannaoensis JCM 10990 TaxID=1227492 RepID=M0AK24_9EURY|nr:glycosyltransferase family 4 protein [Natrialba chahannaoensis]ELY99020.1 group 1 glycosyl transferase [Natrialba chahannaoensis JCM 10990]
MHIGLVVPDDLNQRSGGYRYDRKLVSYLESCGDDVTVCSLSDGEPALNQPFDVLLQDELCSPTLVDRNTALDKPAAIVALIHLLEGPVSKVLTDYDRDHHRRYLESVDAAICTSEFTRELVCDIVTEAIQTHVAPPAGRQPSLPPTLEDATTQARTGPLRLVFVGNVVPRKNVETLLDALAQVDQTIDWTLTIVGDTRAAPDYTCRIHERITTTGIADRLSFYGPVTDDVLESVLARSHVLAMPSHYESFGMVYLEAMEAGVVPIASAVGGASELVVDDTNGFVVDPTDTERITSIVTDLARDRERLVSLVLNGLQTADAHPSWETTFAKLRTFLTEVSDGVESPPSTGSEQP